MTQSNTQHEGSARLPLLDALRGLAILAMFTYHFAWDLGYFRLIDPQFPASAGFHLYGHLIASSFLALSGIGLVLAFARPVPWPGFWQRLALISAGAGAITLATLWLFPHSFIFFGILHCIALSSVLALPFLRAPLWLVVATAAAAFAAPVWIALPVLDAPAVWWLGLGTHAPPSNDYRPLLPWFGMVLLGIGAARMALTWPIAPLHLRHSRLVLRLAWAGRHSLLIYMLHQPVLFGIVFGAAQIAAAPPISAEAAFGAHCELQCAAGGSNAAMCVRACGCLVAKLKADKLWPDVVAGQLPASASQRFAELAMQCRGEAQK